MPNSKTQSVRRKHHKNIKRMKRKVKEQRAQGQKDQAPKKG